MDGITAIFFVGVSASSVSPSPTNPISKDDILAAVIVITLLGILVLIIIVIVVIGVAVK